MTNEELLQVIEEAKVSGATRLDLSDKGITSLPSEICRLKSLTWLNLDRNQLTHGRRPRLPMLRKLAGGEEDASRTIPKQEEIVAFLAFEMRHRDGIDRAVRTDKRFRKIDAFGLDIAFADTVEVGAKLGWIIVQVFEADREVVPEQSDVGLILDVFFPARFASDDLVTVAVAHEITY